MSMLLSLFFIGFFSSLLLVAPIYYISVIKKAIREGGIA